MTFSKQKLRPYAVPFLATIAMIFFAIIYEPRVPFWWVVSFFGILFVYSYLYNKSQK